mmetsp:Transcript_95069/g.188333  ORF Transcript_95069/g.188333 Transcript_95069/m.188333 type:complete len:195 (+) Transcript_95069:221-805(+)
MPPLLAFSLNKMLRYQECLALVHDDSYPTPMMTSTPLTLREHHICGQIERMDGHIRADRYFNEGRMHGKALNLQQLLGPDMHNMRSPTFRYSTATSLRLARAPEGWTIMRCPEVTTKVALPTRSSTTSRNCSGWCLMREARVTSPSPRTKQPWVRSMAGMISPVDRCSAVSGKKHFGPSENQISDSEIAEPTVE